MNEQRIEKELRAVAVVEDAGESATWAAYIGLATWDAQRVADEGEKLPESVARLIFPGVRAVYWV